MKLQLAYPLDVWKVTQNFGGDKATYGWLGIEGHNGLDLYALDGTIVRAAHDGIVTFAGEDGSAGLGVVIRTNQKYEYEGGEAYFKTLYWHLKRGSIKVKADQKVYCGDILGLADNTGFSTGSHLHFGLKPVAKGERSWEWYNEEQDNGYKGAIDPTPYFTGQFARDIARLRAYLIQFTVFINSLFKKDTRVFTLFK